MKIIGQVLRSRKLRLSGMAAIVGWLSLAAIASAEVKHLDAAVRKAILTEHFRIVERVADIPGAVMTAAQAARDPKLAQYKIEMADPGQPFQVTDVVVKPGLPGRRLMAAYASDDYWILHYEVGGIAHTFHFAVFSLKGDGARLVWHADVRHDVATLDSLRKLLAEHDAAEIDDTFTEFY